MIQDHPATPISSSHPKIHRIYSGPDGQSHLDQICLDNDMVPFLDVEGAHGMCTHIRCHNNLQFRTSPAGYELLWHTAPRRQLMILLRGVVELEMGDGSRLQCHPGDVVLAEDTTGQGHVTRVLGDEPRFYAIVPLHDDALVYDAPQKK